MLRAYLMTRAQRADRASHRGATPVVMPSCWRRACSRPVVKCDVESLYPSIMLSEGITSSRDTSGLSADAGRSDPAASGRESGKAAAREAGQRPSGRCGRGCQGRSRCLINSFYGYLGYGGGLFNDYDAAERVTLAGQRIVKQSWRICNSMGPRRSRSIRMASTSCRRATSTTRRGESSSSIRLPRDLPAGIRLSHDGRYAGMLSLRLNLCPARRRWRDDAQGERPAQPAYGAVSAPVPVDAARRFLRDERDAVREDYFALAERIAPARSAAEEIVQWGMINDETLAKFPRLQRLMARLPNPALGRPGGRLEFYERQDGELV